MRCARCDLEIEPGEQVHVGLNDYHASCAPAARVMPAPDGGVRITGLAIPFGDLLVVSGKLFAIWAVLGAIVGLLLQLLG
jgi:hypothetical protein